MPTNDETFYLQALNELENDQRQEGLWAKALTLEKGNAEQAKYLYVQLRVEQLKTAPATEEPVPLTQNDELLEKKSGVYSFVSPSADLTKYTVFALWLLVLMSVVAVISDSMQLNLLDNIKTITAIEAEGNDLRVLVVDRIHIAMSVIAWVMVLMWTYRANKNCRGFGAQGMRFTPGWTVGWHFVPGMNLFRPYQVMQEIWKVSTDPVTWQKQAGSLLIKWWWFAYLVGTFFGQYFFKLSVRNMNTESISKLGEITTSSIMVNCALLLSGIVTIGVISAIADKQNKLVTGQ